MSTYLTTSLILFRFRYHIYIYIFVPRARYFSFVLDPQNLKTGPGHDNATENMKAVFILEYGRLHLSASVHIDQKAVALMKEDKIPT